MKSKWTRLLAFVMVACMMFTMLAACADDTSDDGKDPENPSNTDTQPGNTDEDPGEEDIIYTAEVPDDFSAGGTTFTVYTYPEEIFVWKDFDWQNAGTINSDRINDAVFQRSSQVEEELDMTIEWYCGASYGDPAEFKTDITSGGGEFDIGNVTMLNHIAMVQSGQLAEINSYGVLDLEAPWWDPNILGDLAINDMNFCLTGDIGTMYKRSIAVILFNKVLMQDIGQEDPYSLIDTHEWTIDMLIEMAENVSQDLDTNDEWDENDRYGLVYFSDMMCALEIGAGVTFAQIVDGVPEMTLNCEEAVNVLETASYLLFDEELSYNVTSNGQTEETMWTMFMADQALFYYGELHSAEDMRASTSNFGIMPMPLYDEYQESYHHTVNPNVAAVIVIPITNQEDLVTSYALDSLGAASKNILTPAYYDINLKGIVSRDEESAVSLDLILSTLSYDPGYLYISEAGLMLRELTNAKSDAFASKYSAQESVMNSKIEKIVEAIADKYS